MQHNTVAVAQINTKRHWRFAGTRIKKMVKMAAAQGVTAITFNEISKEQVLAVRSMPGWDIHHTVNDVLPKGGYAGNAVAWKTSEWDLKKAWGSAVEIAYRPGTLRSGLGRPIPKTITQACVTLRNKETKQPLVVQAFHFPTEFNSGGDSRPKSANKTARFAAGRIKRGFDVVTGGDGNNIFPETKGLHMSVREGPDAILSNGKCVNHRVLPFKKRGLSDHNGVIAVLRFGAN